MSFYIGLFIFLFLLLFKPFGLATTGKQLVFFCLMYGMITFLVSLGFNTIVNYLVQKDQPTWVFWKWILVTLLLIFCIALANYLFGLLVFDNFHFSLFALLGMILNTLLLGAFPLVFIGSILLIQNRQKNVGIANELSIPIENNHNETIQLGETTYLIDDILFVAAMQNYVIIHSKTLPNQTLRSTLTKLENELTIHNVIRCHRSYLINISSIKSVSGNAQGLKLNLHNSNQIVPVSRKYIPKIKEILA